MKITLILPAIILLASCGGSGGGDDDTPDTQPDIEFRLKSEMFFSIGNSSFAITGTDNEGGRYTGNLSVINNGIRVVNGLDGIEIKSSAAITVTNAEAEFTDSYTTQTAQYWSADTKRLLGYINFNLSETYLRSTTFELPTFGSIGDAGTVGVYSSDLGYTDTITWRLFDHSTGFAKLEVINVTFDDLYNEPFSTVTTTTVIDVNGATQTVDTVIEYNDYSIVYSLTFTPRN